MTAAGWAKIKRQYVTANIGYRKLAQNNDLSESVVRKHMERENWKDARTEYRAKLGKRVAVKEQEAIEQDAESIFDYNAQHLDDWNNLRESVIARISSINTGSDLRDVAMTLTAIQKGQRLCLNLDNILDAGNDTGTIVIKIGGRRLDEQSD